MSVTTKQLVGLHSQTNEILKRVDNGSLDGSVVKRALQNIIENKVFYFDWSQPAWWRTPEQQIERAQELWPDVELPDPPTEFWPQSRTGVLLLHVPDPSFSKLWDLVPTKGKKTAPAIYLYEQPISNYRLGYKYTEAAWVEFDPEYGKGVSPREFLKERAALKVAGNEVLSALIQFPLWQYSWFYTTVLLSACWIGDDRSRVPSIQCLPLSDEINLRATPLGYENSNYVSPSVRVLN